MGNIRNPKFLALCLGVTADLIVESDDSGPEMLLCLISQLAELGRCIPDDYNKIRVRVMTRFGVTLITLAEYKRGFSILRERLLETGHDRKDHVRRSVERALRGIAKQLENI